jgi:hypothetical protein
MDKPRITRTTQIFHNPRDLRLEFDQAASQTAADCFGPRRCAKLAEYRSYVKFDCVFGDPEPECDLLVAEAVSQ